jgi:hypothetical protein
VGTVGRCQEGGLGTHLAVPGTCITGGIRVAMSGREHISPLGSQGCSRHAVPVTDRSGAVKQCSSREPDAPPWHHRQLTAALTPATLAVPVQVLRKICGPACPSVVPVVSSGTHDDRFYMTMKVGAAHAVGLLGVCLPGQHLPYHTGLSHLSVAACAPHVSPPRLTAAAGLQPS